MAFGSSINLGNITENWLFQFGFYNGDSDGNGDGGFSKVTRADGTLNQVKVAINNTVTTSIDVDDTSVFVVGDFIKISGEIFQISAIVDSDTLTVVRGVKGSTKETHAVDDQIFWNNYLPLSFSSVTQDEVFYFPVIISKPSIRQSINLLNSTAKTGNVSITIDDFLYKNESVAKELFGGTRKYINHEVKIFIKINNDTPNQIGSFRLVDISTNGKSVKLQLTAHRPFDFVSYPQEKTEHRNEYIPIVYGEYSPNNSRQTSQDYCNEKKLFPTVKFDRGGVCSGFVHTSLSSDARPHIYEENLDAFIPITSSASATSFDDTSSVFAGANIVGTNINMFRGFKFKPIGVHSDNNWLGAPGNTIDQPGSDDDAGTFTQEIREISTTNTTATDSLVLSVPAISGTCTQFQMVVRYFLKATITDIMGFSVMLKNNTGGDTTIIKQLTGNAGEQTHGPANSSTITMGLSNASLPSKVKIDLISTTVTGSGTLRATARIFDVRLFVKVENDFASEPINAKKTAGETKVYCGADGLTDNGWNSGSSITEIHEVHRDLLSRFAGLDDADPVGWSDLNSAKAWKIRYWQHDPIDLEKGLEKLQHEGGFIYEPTANKYIFIKNSYGTLGSDKILSKNDISKIDIKLSSTNELLTKMTINYEKHPARNNYVTSVTSSNDSARKEFNIKSAENVKNVNLDMYCSPVIPATPNSDPNNDYYSYYNAIFGTIKLIVSFDIVNPKFYSLEIGDIIEFDENNMYPKVPFGHNGGTWNNLKFMIISLTRKVGMLSIQAREVENDL